MEEPRKKRRGEPPDGTPLGALSDFAEGEATVIDHQVDGRVVMSMLVVRRGDVVRLFVNACPHNWLPLTWRSDRVVSADGERLTCSNHGAQFSVDDGRAVAGIALDCALIAIPVFVDAANRVRVGNPAA